MANEKGRPDKEQERLLKQLQQLLQDNSISVLGDPAVKRVIEAGEEGFFFEKNDVVNKAANKLLQSMAKRMDAMLLNAIEHSWKQGEDGFWDKQKEKLGGTATEQEALDKIREAATQKSRERTAKAFYHEKRDGFSVSERVWNLAGNAKKEMEIIIQNGIKEGLSAAEVQKSLKGYLNEPNALFRRVRNEKTGQLELSQAAQRYHPGRGVYRSAYANAMRLARTEMNAAYRQAEWESYQNDPLVTGYRIVLSNNHTTLKDGTPVKLKDICDELQGEYPKTFRWTGWHPQCRCRMEPIMSRTNFREYLKVIDDGTEERYTPKTDVIKRPPRALDEWIKDNQERAKGWSNMPRFVRNNPSFVKTKFETGIYSEEEKKFTRTRTTKEAMQRVLNELTRLYPDIPNTELAAIHHFTKSGGNYRQLNKQMGKGTLTDFNQAAQVLVAQGLQKLPVHEGVVYRGMIIKRKEFEKAFGGEIGDEFQHNRFVSASMSEKVSEQFSGYKELEGTNISVRMVIESKTGRDISRISEKNGSFARENQQEVLFPNNTRFRIIGKRVLPDGTIVLKLREI